MVNRGLLLDKQNTIHKKKVACNFPQNNNNDYMSKKMLRKFIPDNQEEKFSRRPTLNYRYMTTSDSATQKREE